MADLIADCGLRMWGLGDGEMGGFGDGEGD